MAGDLRITFEKDMGGNAYRDLTDIQVRTAGYKFAGFTIDNKRQAIGTAFPHQDEIFISCPVGKPDFEINYLASDQVANYKLPFRLWIEEIADPRHAL